MAFRLTKIKVIAALRETDGNIFAASQRLECSRTTIYDWAERDAEVKAVIAESRETMIDLAEASLRRAVVTGEGWAVAFTLKTLGKGRGFVEQNNQQHSGAVTLQTRELPPLPDDTLDGILR